MNLKIHRFDTRGVAAGTSASAELLRALRAKLQPDGDVVSPRGKALTARVFGSPLRPTEVVARVCQEIRQEGDAALLRYTAAFDQQDFSADQLRVPAEDLQAAHQRIDRGLIESIRRIRTNVKTFQQAIRHQDVSVTPSPGVELAQRYLPLRRIGICVPGGAAAYPSTVLMTVVPAQVAGVDEIAIVAPPTPFGAYNDVMLATCYELGVTEVYRVGGAQAIAALAYGTATIAKVDKIVGPGNLFVALAKKHVYGDVDIDSFAGPSEVVVIADKTANAAFVAADLLAQAEHSPGSAILITDDETLLNAVEIQLTEQIDALDRAALTGDSLNAFGALILVANEAEACQLADQFAPEHLHLQIADPQRTAKQIRNAGAIFLGSYTPVALGDYAAGPSHVLPTGGTCTWASGLTCNSFLRGGSVTSFDQPALQEIAGDVERLAMEEGLTAHARSVRIRLI